MKNELYHHGILGQKWGVRRYQNKDGTLTSEGKKRQNQQMLSDKEVTLQKGHVLYRVSDKASSDASSDKLYVNSGKEGNDFYITTLGKGKIYNKGKAYVHEYIANNDIKMPDKKTMEKIELGLLNDKDVRTELIDSLIKKGYTRENAEKQVQAYSIGKDAINKIGAMTVGAILGGSYGGMIGVAGGIPGMIVGAGGGAIAGAAAVASVPSYYKKRALDTVRMSYGDKNNVITNSKLQERLAEKGYNAIKDYNDRRAYGENGRQAMIVFNSDKNLSLKSSTKLDPIKFADAYASNYQRKNKKSDSSRESLLKSGMNLYNTTYENGVINRAKEQEAKEERERLLKKGSK